MDKFIAAGVVVALVIIGIITAKKWHKTNPGK